MRISDFDIKNRTHKSALMVFILALIIFMSSFIAGTIKSNGWDTKITTHELETRDNQTLVYDLYVPEGVTEENKAPAIVVIAGFQRTRETQEHIGLELAKRGFVILSIDPYSQGDSSSSAGVEGSAIATIEGYGAFDLIDWVYDNDDVYPFIDKDRIGVTGHSAV